MVFLVLFFFFPCFSCYYLILYFFILLINFWLYIIVMCLLRHGPPRLPFASSGHAFSVYKTKKYKSVKKKKEKSEQNPCRVFSSLNVGPTINELPGEKRPIDIFQLFISDEVLDRIARWTNQWFQVKKAAEPNKHKAPFAPITDIAELKAYISVLLAMNQNIDLPRYEHSFCQDESTWLLLTPGFHKVYSEKRFSQLNRYIFL